MKRGYLAALFMIFLSACASNQIKTTVEYYNSLDYSCSADNDCEVKNVGNCCGYYPGCVNKNFNPDKEVLSEVCRGKFSVCGFNEIKSCSCNNNKCEAKQ